MAAASDKARFHLEQTVPELREWERREIFSKDEISAIAAKRSDFEHVLNARGSKPSDYVKYAEYEMNLDLLRRKRVKRKGVKTTAYTGQRRIFSILDRATSKFHGDIGLWMQYIDYAKKQKANKRLNRILTDALRMHPTNADLWIFACRHAMDFQADIGTARSYMQRALRFCPKSKLLYLEYARLEMTYIAKLTARRKILGLDDSTKQTTQTKGDAAEDHNSDMITLPTISAEEAGMTDSEKHEALRSMWNTLSSNSLMSGAIPMAIFDAAMKQFAHDDALGEQFFDLFSEFYQLACLPKILNHVIDELRKSDENSIATLVCQCKLPLQGFLSDSPDFPAVLRLTLKEIKSCFPQTSKSRGQELAAKLHSWLTDLMNTEDLVPELRLVINSTLRQLSAEGGLG